MQQRAPSRREVLAAAAAAGAMVWVGSTGRARTAPATRPRALRVRKSALELPANDPVFAKYAEAVRLMHQEPQGSLRSWMNQAKIHADHCRHGLPSFLHWHRHYLARFEQICGHLIGDDTFALPYWDWTHGTGPIPDPLVDLPNLTVEKWQDPGKYNSQSPDGWGFPIDTIPVRAFGKGVGLQAFLQLGGPFTRSNIDSIEGEDFPRFVRRLEGEPHNTAHGLVGSAAAGLGHMGSGLSSLDPLFWLHHCNVDRIWARWQMAGNATPELAETYDGHFCDVQGEPVPGLTSKGALDFAKLGYTYEEFGDPNEFREIAKPAPADAVQPVKPKTLGARDGVTAEFLTRTDLPVSVNQLQEELNQTSAARNTALPPLETIRKSKLNTMMLADFGKPVLRQRRILAHFRDVVPAVDGGLPAVNVFLNCPYLAPETPYTDRTYAGTFAFFHIGKGDAAGHHHDDGAREFFVDLTPAIRRGNLADLSKLTVQLMALPAGRNAEVKGTIKVGAVEIISA